MRSILLILLPLLSFQLLGAQTGFVQRGNASYYADRFHGRPTASGERYNKNAYTAAHRELPFGTLIRVTNLDNQNSVVVRVNDRGPFTSGRVLDLSRASAQRLGMIATGTARIEMEVVGRDNVLEDATATREPAVRPTPSQPIANNTRPTPEPTPANNQTRPAPEPTPNNNNTRSAPEPNPANNNTRPAPEPNPANNTNPSPTPNANSARPFTVAGTYQPNGQSVNHSGKFCIQLGAFSSLDNAQELVGKIKAKGYHNTFIQVVLNSSNTLIYKVVLGVYNDRETAAQNQRELNNRGIEGFVSTHR